jgi:hypothetical protein
MSAFNKNNICKIVHSETLREIERERERDRERDRDRDHESEMIRWR